MIYVITGVDQKTFAPWHDNVMATDVTTSTRIARARAASRGIELEPVFETVLRQAVRLCRADAGPIDILDV